MYDAPVFPRTDPLQGGSRIIAALFALGLSLVLMQAAFPLI